MGTIEHDIELPEVLPDNWARAGLANAVRGLSKLMGRSFELRDCRMLEIPIYEVSEAVGGPETEMVGIYLLTEGELNGQAIMLLALPDALRMVDLLLDLPEGTTCELDDLERSALAEVGNVAASLFLNTIADAKHSDCRPSPPAVMVDMLGAIMSVVVASLGACVERLIVIETLLCDADRTVNARFWIAPKISNDCLA